MEATRECVLNYLKEQNRPYSLADIFNNLHKAVKKAALQRDLDSLVESGQVVEKTYGKQKIYYASQEHTSAPSDEDLAAIDKEIETLEEQVASKTECITGLEAQIRALENSISSEDCRRKITAFKELNDALETEIKLLGLREQCEIDPAERAALTEQHKFLAKELKTRKKLCHEVLSTILGNYPGGKAELAEEIGLDLNEA